MKNFNCNYGLLICLFFLSACNSAELTWNYDGSVGFGTQHLETKLDNAYIGFVTEQGVFLAGYQIDNQDINHPLAALVKPDLTHTTYWPLKDDAKQFFQYKHSIYLLSNTGSVFEYNNSGWQESGRIQLSPNSIVIDSSQNIIACTPAPLMKTNKQRGNCYSPDKGWKLDINWRSVTPALCGKYLITIEDGSPTVKAHQIEVTSGKIIKSTDVTTAIDNVCAVEFD